jgi:hypothetical protein
MMLLLVPWMAPEEQNADASWAARVAAASAFGELRQRKRLCHTISVSLSKACYCLGIIAKFDGSFVAERLEYWQSAATEKAANGLPPV